MAASNRLLPVLAVSQLSRLIGAAAAASVTALASQSEGTVTHTYWDPVPILTACTGHTDPNLKIGMKFTSEQCAAFLEGDLTKATQGMQNCVDVMLDEGELVAYTDFTFNEGIAAFCGSTLRKKLNDGDHIGACTELLRWDKALIKGKMQVLPGLSQRRHKEYEFCAKGKL